MKYSKITTDKDDEHR